MKTNRWVSFSSILIFFIFLSLKNFAGNIPHHSKFLSASSFDNIENEILNYVNMHRKAIGLKPLEWNDFESSTAATHSHNMATGKVGFGHAGFEKRIKRISGKIGFVSSSAENVAYGAMNAKEVVDVWLQSPEHKKNIEGNFSLTGIAVAKNKKGVIYFTEIFTR